MAAYLPLSIRLHASRSAAVALSAIHGSAIAAIVVSLMPLIARMALLALIVASMVLSMRIHAMRSGRRAVMALTLRDQDELELEYGDGRRLVTRIDASSTAWYRLLALQLRGERQRLSLFLLPDMMDAESWRRLAVVLHSRKDDQAK